MFSYEMYHLAVWKEYHEYSNFYTTFCWKKDLDPKKSQWSRIQLLVLRWKRKLVLEILGRCNVRPEAMPTYSWFELLTEIRKKTNRYGSWYFTVCTPDSLLFKLNLTLVYVAGATQCGSLVFITFIFKKDNTM